MKMKITEEQLKRIILEELQVLQGIKPSGAGVDENFLTDLFRAEAGSQWAQNLIRIRPEGTSDKFHSGLVYKLGYREKYDKHSDVVEINGDWTYNEELKEFSSSESEERIKIKKIPSSEERLKGNRTKTIEVPGYIISSGGNKGKFLVNMGIIKQ